MSCYVYACVSMANQNSVFHLANQDSRAKAIDDSRTILRDEPRRFSQAHAPWCGSAVDFGHCTILIWLEVVRKGKPFRYNPTPYCNAEAFTMAFV